MVTISDLCSHTKKSSENCVYALAATRNRQVAPERLVQTRATFTKSVMVSMAVSKLGRMVRNRPDFDHAKVKINDAYYRDSKATACHA